MINNAFNNSTGIAYFNNIYKSSSTPYFLIFFYFYKPVEQPETLKQLNHSELYLIDITLILKKKKQLLEHLIIQTKYLDPNSFQNLIYSCKWLDNNWDTKNREEGDRKK